MSTTKPRVTVTLEKHAHEVLTRLSAASGDSMSQIIAGFVDLAVPSLERVVVVLERAKAAPEEVRVGLTAAIERADRQLMPQLVNTLDQTDLFLSDALQATASAGVDARAAPPARPARPSSPKGREAVPTPVPVTRGSGGGKTLTRGRRDGTV